MAEEYVRTEVFEAYMARMEALQEKNAAEMRADNERFRNDVNAAISDLKADNAQLRSDFRAAVAEMRAIANETKGEVRALAEHVHALEFWGVVLIAAATLYFAVAQYFQSKRGEGEKKVLQPHIAEMAEAGKGA